MPAPERSLEETIRQCPDCSHSLYSHSPDGCVELPCPCLLSQDAVRAALSPKQGELPPRPEPDCVRYEGGCGFHGSEPAYIAETAHKHFDALESLLRASNAEVGRLREELEAVEDMSSVGESLMKAIEAHSELLGPWHPVDCPSEIVGDLLDRSQTTFAAGQQKGREECAKIANQRIEHLYEDLPANEFSDRDKSYKMALQWYQRAILALPKVGE